MWLYKDLMTQWLCLADFGSFDNLITRPIVADELEEKHDALIGSLYIDLMEM